MALLLIHLGNVAFSNSFPPNIASNAHQVLRGSNLSVITSRQISRSNMACILQSRSLIFVSHAALSTGISSWMCRAPIQCASRGMIYFQTKGEVFSSLQFRPMIHPIALCFLMDTSFFLSNRIRWTTLSLPRLFSPSPKLQDSPNASIEFQISSPTLLNQKTGSLHLNGSAQYFIPIDQPHLASMKAQIDGSGEVCRYTACCSFREDLRI